MALEHEDLEITSKDLRVGMGIGGYNMEHTIIHTPTGCKISWQSHGAHPRYFEFKEFVLEALEFMVLEYEKGRY